MIRSLVPLAALIFLVSAGPTASFELRDGDRVVLIGNAFIEHAGHYGYIETALTTRWPDRRITFRNLGWSGDSVSGEARIGFGPGEHTSGGWVPPRVKDSHDYGFEKLLQQVRAEKPSVVVIGYGSNAAFTGETGLSGFAKGLSRLLDELEKSTSRVVLFSPIPQEDLGPPMLDPSEHNKWRRRNSQHLRQVADQRGYAFVDLFSPFERIAKGTHEVRAKGPRVTENSIHLNAGGYRHASRIVEQELGVPRPPWNVQLTAAGSVVEVSGTEITDLQVTSGGLQFQLKDETLPAFQMLTPESGRRVLRVAGLGAGRHTLRIDDEPYVTASAREWDRGIPLARGPEFDHAERLRETINGKNRFFFYRYRPHNKTYVLLFRRYEMGHLAAELEHFDPLIDAKEKTIATLCKPVVHRYEVVHEQPHSKNKYMPDLIPDPDPVAELNSFKVADGFEINLFRRIP